MAELDETTIREHMRRRAGNTPDRATLDRVVAAVQDSVRHETQRSAGWRGLRDALPWPARLGVAIAVVAAISFIAVPIVGGPRSSMSPRPSVDPSNLRVLDAAALARLSTSKNLESVAGRVVIVDALVSPAPRQMTCLPDSCPIAELTEVDPPIRLVESQSQFALGMSIPDGGMRAILAVSIRGTGTVELIGRVETNVGRNVSWPLGSFQVDAATKDYDRFPGGPTLGPLYVVHAYLADAGATVRCLLVFTPSPPPGLDGFKCGRAAWLTPSPDLDPSTTVDGNFVGQPDWVRLPNGSYQRFAIHPALPSASPDHGMQLGYYLIEPVIDPNSSVCNPCHPGGSAVMVARIEPVAIP
jgi:hypothetical protein